MAAKSFEEIMSYINNALNNPTTDLQWEGTNGLKNILTQLNIALKDKSTIYYPDATALSYAGGIDGGYGVIIGEDGLNFYKWYPNVDVAIVNGITSSAGGQWRPIFAIVEPSESPWEPNGSGDVVLKTEYLDNGVAIAKNTVTSGLAFDIGGTDKAIRIPVVTNAQMAAITPKVVNSLIFNSDMAMLLRYDSFSTAYRSAGTFSNEATGGVSMSATTLTVTLPITMPDGSFTPSVTPLDAYTKTLLAAGYYVSARTTNSFTITFSAAASAGTYNLLFTIIR